MSPAPSSIRSLALLVPLAALPACSSSPVAHTESPPPDFTLAITVLAREGPGAAADPRAIARPYRPGRYILEPDGQLRAAIGAGARPASFPPAMRRLTAAERREVWDLAGRAGYLQITEERSIDAASPPALVSRPTAMVYIVGFETTRGTQVVLDAPDAEASRVLVDRLAELAWVEE